MSTRLISLIENLPASRVLLIGDFMVDKYVFGSTERVSPEAPIPVLRYAREEYRLGGAGFVLAGLCELGARVKAVGVVGKDDTGRILCQRMSALGADCAVSVQLDAGRCDCESAMERLGLRQRVRPGCHRSRLRVLGTRA